MFLQNKGHVTMTIELLDTEEAQADDPLDVQVNTNKQTKSDLVLFACLMGNIECLIFPVFSVSACRATWSSL